MEIIKYVNPDAPEQVVYKCKIGNLVRFGTLEKITAWRDDWVLNEEVYLLNEENSKKSTALFYKELDYKGD